MDPARFSTTPASLNDTFSLRKKPAPLRGNLKKQGEGALAGWKKRYFAQVEDKVHYFVSQKDMNQGAKGSIDLQAVTSVRQPDPIKYPNRFELVTADRVYRLETYEESDKHVSEWIKNVAEWLEYIDFRRKRQKKIEASLQSGDAIAPFLSSDPATTARQGATSLPANFASIIQSHQPTQPIQVAPVPAPSAPIQVPTEPVEISIPTQPKEPATLEALLATSLRTIGNPQAAIIQKTITPAENPNPSPRPVEAQTTPRDHSASVTSLNPRKETSPSVEAQPKEDSQSSRRPSVSNLPSAIVYNPGLDVEPIRPNQTPSQASTQERRSSVSTSQSGDDRAKTFSGGFNFLSKQKKDDYSRSSTSNFQPLASTATPDRRATWHEPEIAPVLSQPPPPVSSNESVRERSRSLSEFAPAKPATTETLENSGLAQPPSNVPEEPKTPSALDKIAETRVDPVALAMQVMTQQSGASLLQASPAALIAQQEELQRSRPKTLEEMSDAEIRKIYEEILSEVEREEAEVEQARKDRNAILDEIKAQEKREQDAFNAEKARLEREILEADDMIEQYMKRVAQLDQELRDKELECDEENWKLYMARENHLEQQYLEASLEKELEDITREIAAREENIERVQKALDLVRITHNPKKTWPDSVMPLLAELKQIWNEKAETQHRIEALERRMRRTRLELEATFKAKKDILEVLDRELAATHEAYLQLESFLMDREGVEPAMLDQIDEIKDLLFHALVVGIKLEGEVTGAWTIRDDVDPSQLEHKAIIKGVDWRSWRGWIKRELIQSDEAYSYDPLHDFLSRLGSHKPKKRVNPDVPKETRLTESSSKQQPKSTSASSTDVSNRPMKKLAEPLPPLKKKPVRTRITQIEEMPDDK